MMPLQKFPYHFSSRYQPVWLPMTVSEQILYIHPNLSCVPWEGSAAAVVPPTSLPVCGLSHIFYRGCRETQVGWDGETYCLVCGFQVYGDASLAKSRTEKPLLCWAPKRPQALAELDKVLSCSVPKTWHLRRVGIRSVHRSLLAEPFVEDKCLTALDA
nr:DPEP2 neighbor protein [Oryctolagus cuniculus]